MNTKKILKNTFKFGLIAVALPMITIMISNWLVIRNTKDKIYQSTNEVPFNKVGLLLGTGKYLRSGRVNLYYTNRIKAASDLYKSGKVKFLLVSGDNSRKDYDEPTEMKDDLIAEGVPVDKIFLDYAGFRTLDSVIRCKEIFGQEEFTVISQQFHNERAIFIAQKKGLKAIGYNASDVAARYGFKIQQREKLARVKMMLDLTFGKAPKFLGNKIEIK